MGVRPVGSDPALRALLPVALDALEVVPVRAGALVLVDELGIGLRDVVARGGDEGVLVHAVLDALPPTGQRLSQRREVLLHVVEHAEVDQRQAAGQRGARSPAIDCSHASRSNSGGGHGGMTKRAPWSRTPAASPA